MYEIMNQGPVQALFQVYTGRISTVQDSLLGVHRQNQIPVQYSSGPILGVNWQNQLPVQYSTGTLPGVYRQNQYSTEQYD